VRALQSLWVTSVGGVKILPWFLVIIVSAAGCNLSRLRVPVHNFVENRDDSVPPFIKRSQFNELHSSNSGPLQTQIAPKNGIDSFGASVYLGFRRRLKGLA
jgi:hypothetical protein